MQLPGLSRRRSQTFLLILGQLVLIAYVFQVGAFDHWHSQPIDGVTGVAGTSAHAALHSDHCHGGPSSCAEAGGGFAQVSPGQTTRLPSSTPSLALDVDSGAGEPTEAFVTDLPEPPRAIA